MYYVDQYGRPVDQFGNPLPVQPQQPVAGGYPQPTTTPNGYQPAQRYPARQPQQTQQSVYGQPQQPVTAGYPQPTGRYNNRPAGYNPNTQPGNVYQQTQQPIYGQPQQNYQQPASVNLGRPYNPNNQPITTTATTPSSITDRISERVQQRQSITQVEQQTIVTEEPKQKPKPTKPIEGHEYKPLVLPIYKVIKEYLNDTYFKYEIIEKESDMDLEKHRMVYGELSEGELQLKEYKPEVVADNEEVAIVDNIAEAFTSIYALGLANKEKVLVKDLMVNRPLFVKTKTNAKIENLFINAVKNSKDIKEFVSNYRHLIVKLTSDAVDVGTGKVINKMLTRKFNALLELRYNNEISIDDFLEDIEEVLEFVENLSPSKKTMYRNCMIDFMSRLKSDIKEFEELTDPVNGEVKIEEFYSELLELDDEHKLMFMPETFLTVINFSNKLVYELSEACNEPKMVLKEQTPILYNTIASVFNTVKDEGKDILIFTADRCFYRVLKSVNGKYVIKKVGEG